MAYKKGSDRRQRILFPDCIDEYVEADAPVRLFDAFVDSLKMDELGFGNCTNTGACAAECPKNIKLSNIARLNREFLCAKCSD